MENTGWNGKPLTIERTLSMMKSQVKIWRVHKKLYKANVVAKAIVAFEEKSQITLDRLWKSYNEVKYL
jgi:hypothetical protein